MCGITGTYNFRRSTLQNQYTGLCLRTMQHRGPDAQQIWNNNENYVTGFVRLAIRDTSNNGNQPMLSEDGNYCLTFNGEIYNTQVLINKLKPFRSSFKSSSDTEVLLYALVYLGIKETLNLADGMFAFAFFCVQQNTLFLARDRVGIKPLYIGKSLNGIVYSSQYDHIINHPFFKSETFDEHAIATYLQLGYMPEGNAVLNNTCMLPHGRYAEIKNNVVNIHPYYTYNITKNNKEQSLSNILALSVAEQLISDVPAGTFMSGGVDSTLVSYYANKQQQLNAFTIGTNDSHLNEAEAAADFASTFNINHYCKYISQSDILQLTDANVKAFTEPFADFSSLPTLMLSQFAKQYVTVALSGDGGDELFWGYMRSRKALKYLHFYKHSNLQRKAAIIYKKVKQPAAIDIRRHWNQNSFIDYCYSALFINGAAYWLPKICHAAPVKPSFYSESKELYNKDLDDATVMNIVRKMEVDLHLQRILQKVDRASMYYSLEVRVPLLSNNMLELSKSFNYNDCIKGEQGKMPLKKLLLQHSKNPAILQPKKGFDVPVNKWLRNELKQEITEKIMDMPVALSHIFDKSELQKMLATHAKGSADFGWFIWAVYSLAAWHDKHVNKFSASGITAA